VTIYHLGLTASAVGVETNYTDKALGN